MNTKINEIVKLANLETVRIYKTFSSDEYGSWSNSTSGHGGYASVSHGGLWSRFWYNGNGGWCNGSASSSRTIENLRHAQEISFTYYWARRAEVVSGWNGGWTAYMRLLGSYVNCNYNSVYVNGTALRSISEGATHSFVFRQRYCIIDGTKYDYPQGVSLKNATSDSCSAYCNMGQTTHMGYASAASISLSIGDMTIKW